MKNFFNRIHSDIKRNWVDTNRKENTMSLNLLLVYEIADKASRVKTKKAYREFERWIRDVMQTYRDAAIERVANIHLFELRQQFGV